MALVSLLANAALLNQRVPLADYQVPALEDQLKIIRRQLNNPDPKRVSEAYGLRASVAKLRQIFIEDHLGGSFKTKKESVFVELAEDRYARLALPHYCKLELNL
jgi:hypothetical protein